MKRVFVDVRMTPMSNPRAIMAYHDFVPGITIVSTTEHPALKQVYGRAWCLVHSSSGRLISELVCNYFDDAKAAATKIGELTDWTRDIEVLEEIDGLEGKVNSIIKNPVPLPF